jgi:hypothetical protein
MNTPTGSVSLSLITPSGRLTLGNLLGAHAPDGRRGWAGLLLRGR